MRKLVIAAVVIGGLMLVGTAACVATVFGNYSGLDSEARREETRELDLQAGDTLTLEVPDGDIAVRATTGEPRLVAHWSARGHDQAEAEKVLEQYHLDVVRDAHGVRVRIAGEPLKVSATWGAMRIGAGVDLSAEVPEGTALTAKTGSGDLTAFGPLGACTVTSNYGNIEVRDVSGGLTARTSSGDVSARDVRGTEINLHSDYGNLSMERAGAERLKLESSSGNVSASDVAGRLEIASGYGSIEVVRAEGDVKAKTSSGDITLEAKGAGHYALASDYGDVEARGGSGEAELSSDSGRVSLSGFEGRASARSSYGDVSMNGVFDVLSANTSSGAVKVTAFARSRVAEPWKITSAYGDVELFAPADFACLLDAHTDYGKVRSDFRVLVDPGERKDASLRGEIGAGGSRVELSTSSGDVRLRGLER